MKRRLFALALTFGLCAVAIGPARADDKVNPKCYNLFGGNATYNTTVSPAFVSGQVQTEAPVCKGATYTFTVYDAAGNVLGSSSTPAVDPSTGSTLTFLVNPSSTPSYVCVQFSSARNGKVMDEAPNTALQGCAIGGSVAANTGGGTGWF
jgi:hypothetical protein